MRAGRTGSSVRPQATGGPAMARAALRTVLGLFVIGILFSGVAGGLLRAGAAWPALQGSTLVSQAAVLHAALMLSAFLGSVIAVERAVALHRPWAFAAPVASALGGALLLGGQTRPGAGLGVVAALVFAGVNAVLVLRQPVAHTALLLTGALAWLTGNLLFAADLASSAALPWWFAFVVLTITAERLEMSRLMRHQPLARPLLLLVVASLLAGAALSLADTRMGGALFGISLTALALWFALFDIARRTVRAQGLSRYMALCLLGGYAWLALAGLAWAGTALGHPGRDMALHALGLGFIFSMVMGHAPVILPAVARVKLVFGPWFYAPLALLHASLALRLAGDVVQPGLRAHGASLNAAALALFAVTVVGSAIAARLRGARKPVAATLD